MEVYKSWKPVNKNLWFTVVNSVKSIKVNTKNKKNGKKYVNSIKVMALLIMKILITTLLITDFTSE
jgi:hypothetical protein